jgi:hypothetical protein
VKKAFYKSVGYVLFLCILQNAQKAEMSEVKRGLPYLSVTCFFDEIAVGNG